MHWAARRNRGQAIRLLHRLGANLEAREHQGLTPLHVAARAGCRKSIYSLMYVGADANARDPYGRTPLHWTSEAGTEGGHPEAAALLIKYGARVDDRDHAGKNVMHYAAARGQNDLVLALVKLKVRWMGEMTGAGGVNPHSLTVRLESVG